MRILWLSSLPCQFRSEASTDGIEGGGWIGSLQRLLKGRDDVELAILFPTKERWPEGPLDEKGNCLDASELASRTASGREDGGEGGRTVYFPVYDPKLSTFAKLKFYYGGYRNIDRTRFVEQIRRAVKAFRPDVIHLFGIESALSTALGQIVDVPVVVHLQGFLATYDNAFFPQGFNNRSFAWPPTQREWLLRNGCIFAKNFMHVRGLEELRRFKAVKYAVGRTRWDYQIARLLAPPSMHYSEVNEVLREPFYKAAGTWVHRKEGEKFRIVSTLGTAIYKGVDLVLKTAKLLKEQTATDFEWQLVGVGPDEHFVKMFERTLGIKCKDVHVRCLGRLGADDLCRVLLDASAYVHPSYIDNSPNSLCEAQLVGLPVVATYVGGVPSLIEDGVSGYLVPANAPYELAYRLREMASSRNLCEALSRAGAKAAAVRHDRRQIVDDLLAAYQDAIVDFQAKQ